MKASVKIAFGIVNVSVTRIAPIALGTKCLVIIRTVLAPKDLDAKINSSDFNFNTSPLTILAIPIQPVIVIAIINVHNPDRKSTRLNSSHVAISYAVFCLKKQKKENTNK